MVGIKDSNTVNQDSLTGHFLFLKIHCSLGLEDTIPQCSCALFNCPSLTPILASLFLSNVRLLRTWLQCNKEALPFLHLHVWAANGHDRRLRAK